MKKTTAFAPANISCIFKIHQGNTPETTGSYGCGFTLTEGVTITVAEAKETSVLFNRQHISFPTVEDVITSLSFSTPIQVTITTSLPLGCGFGISGASALATAYAINDLLELDKTKKELAMIAHIAEVRNGTGLGDVINQYIGGCLLKLQPSFLFEAIKIPLDTDKVYCKIFDTLLTKDIIADPEHMKKISLAADHTLPQIASLLSNSQVAFIDVIDIAHRFAKESGLLINVDVLKTITAIASQGGHGSMIMLGNGVFSNIPFEGATQYTIQR